MYQEIATTHINPCIRLVANLPLSASSDKQEEAKASLEQRTEESSEAIQKLAKQEILRSWMTFSRKFQTISRSMET